MKKIIHLVLVAAMALTGLISAKSVNAQVFLTRPILFPVIGTVNYSNDFGAPRDGGVRTHEGVDILGKKLMPLVAVVDGTVSFVGYPEPTWGYSVYIRDKDGYEYRYLHINNDNPGTDDDKGDGFHAYAPDIERGNPVVAGQIIGYMGDSGNAEGTSPHLHFEMHAPGDSLMNPYDTLKAATKITTPVTNYPQLPDELLPYADFSGGASVAVGNVDTDTKMEWITGALAGGGPLVRVFKDDKTPLSAFYAYDPSFRGGVDVAAADLDGDGKAEIITAPGLGGGPHIKVFKSDGSAVVAEFFAYDPTFHGGINIAAADLDGDGKAEIITAPKAGGGPHVKIFNASGILIKEFFAYEAGFHGGVDVTAIAKNTTTTAAVVTAPGTGGGPHIREFDLNGNVVKEFFAYDGNFNLGLRVSADSATIAVLPATGGGPNLKIFGLDGTQKTNTFAAFEEWWRGGYDLAMNAGKVVVTSTSGRRTSLRVYDPSSNNTGGNSGFGNGNNGFGGGTGGFRNGGRNQGN